MRQYGTPAISTVALLAAFTSDTGAAEAMAIPYSESEQYLSKHIAAAPVSTLSSDEALDPFAGRPLIDHVV